LTEPFKLAINGTDAGHLHYGSDYPFTPVSACVALARALQATPLLDEATRAGMWGENALSLFPRLAKRGQEQT
jgi:6-methylsalicylate decarboxylase